MSRAEEEEKNEIIGGWEAAMAEIEDDGSLEQAAPSSERQHRPSTVGTAIHAAAAARDGATTSSGRSSSSSGSSPWESVEAVDAEPVVPDDDDALAAAATPRAGSTAIVTSSAGPPLPAVPTPPPRPLRSSAAAEDEEHGDKEVRCKGEDRHDSSEDERTDGSVSTSSDVHVRADGKRVRRVMRKKKEESKTQSESNVASSDLSAGEAETAEEGTKEDFEDLNAPKTADEVAPTKETIADDIEQMSETTVDEKEASATPVVEALGGEQEPPETEGQEDERDGSQRPTKTPLEDKQGPQAAAVEGPAAESQSQLAAPSSSELKEEENDAAAKVSEEEEIAPAGTTETQSESVGPPALGGPANSSKGLAMEEASAASVERELSNEKTLDDLRAERNVVASPSAEPIPSDEHSLVQKTEAQVESVDPFTVSPRGTPSPVNPFTVPTSASASLEEEHAPRDMEVAQSQPPTQLAGGPKAQPQFDPISIMTRSANAALTVEPLGQDSKPQAVPAKRPSETPSQSNKQDEDSDTLLIVDNTQNFDDTSQLTGDEEGGPMWQASLREAEKRGRGRIRLPEPLMARTRSRADVDTPIVPPLALENSTDKSSPHMIRIDEDEEFKMFGTDVDHKRLRVVQLLVFGSIGLVVGLFGSFFVSSTCHFATANVSVGQNTQTFKLHYGLWKYTPMDSVFKGYSYCYDYDDNFTADAPLAGRIAGLLALVAGMYSVSVLWFYLVFGRAQRFYWRLGVKAAIAAGIFQSLTLLFFLGSVCRRNSCRFGPGAAVTLLSSIAFFVLAYEMSYNRPTSKFTPEIRPSDTDDSNLVGNLEMADFRQGANAFLLRMYHSRQEIMPSLNRVQRSNDQRMGEMMYDGNSYRPPFVAA